MDYWRYSTLRTMTMTPGRRAVRSAAVLAALLSLAASPVGCIDVEDKARHKADWISTDELLFLTNSSRAAALKQPFGAVFVAFSTPWCTSCESTTTVRENERERGADQNHHQH